MRDVWFVIGIAVYWGHLRIYNSLLVLWIFKIVSPLSDIGLLTSLNCGRSQATILWENALFIEGAEHRTHFRRMDFHWLPSFVNLFWFELIFKGWEFIGSFGSWLGYFFVKLLLRLLFIWRWMLGRFSPIHYFVILFRFSRIWVFESTWCWGIWVLISKENCILSSPEFLGSSHMALRSIWWIGYIWIRSLFPPVDGLLGRLLINCLVTVIVLNLHVEFWQRFTMNTNSHIIECRLVMLLSNKFPFIQKLLLSSSLLIYCYIIMIELIGLGYPCSLLFVLSRLEFFGSVQPFADLLTNVLIVQLSSFFFQLRGSFTTL